MVMKRSKKTIKMKSLLTGEVVDAPVSGKAGNKKIKNKYRRSTCVDYMKAEAEAEKEKCNTCRLNASETGKFCHVKRVTSVKKTQAMKLAENAEVARRQAGIKD